VGKFFSEGGRRERRGYFLPGFLTFTWEPISSYESWREVNLWGNSYFPEGFGMKRI